MHIYLDNIFVFSDSIKEYEQYLEIVFQKLRKAELYLKEQKCNLHFKHMVCLKHMIDEQGIHIDEDKIY